MHQLIYVLILARRLDESQEKGLKMPYYYINNDQTQNPGYHHEVHTQEHAAELKIQNKTYLGWFPDEIQAVTEGYPYYRDADGCKNCCPRAHRG